MGRTDEGEHWFLRGVGWKGWVGGMGAIDFDDWYELFVGTYMSKIRNSWFVFGCEKRGKLRNYEFDTN